MKKYKLRNSSKNGSSVASLSYSESENGRSKGLKKSSKRRESERSSRIAARKQRKEVIDHAASEEDNGTLTEPPIESYRDQTSQQESSHSLMAASDNGALNRD